MCKTFFTSVVMVYVTVKLFNYTELAMKCYLLIYDWAYMG